MAVIQKGNAIYHIQIAINSSKSRVIWKHLNRKKLILGWFKDKNLDLVRKV
jgi:hypothetical protein